MKDRVKKWDVLESRITYEDFWLRVRSDRCRTGRGQIVEPYHVIESSTWVNVLALTGAGQVVLVREYRHGVQQVLVGLPGGAVAFPAEEPLAAMQRELREETGYSGGTFFELGSNYPNASNQNNVVYSFLALDVREEQEPDDTEEIEVILQDFVDFYQQAWSGANRLQAMHLATLGLAFHFIVSSDLPLLHTLRARILQGLAL